MKAKLFNSIKIKATNVQYNVYYSLQKMSWLFRIY